MKRAAPDSPRERPIVPRQRPLDSGERTLDRLPHIPHTRNGLKFYPDLAALRSDLTGRAFAHPDDLDLLDLGVPPLLLNDARDLADHIRDYHLAEVVEMVLSEIADEPSRVLADGPTYPIAPALEPAVLSLAAMVAALAVVKTGRKAVARG